MVPDLLTKSVYYPKSMTTNYLNPRLVGVKSNRSAIGARMSIEARPKTIPRDHGRQQLRVLPLERHFGRAEMEKVEAVEIRWPSGLKQRFTGIR